MSSLYLLIPLSLLLVVLAAGFFVSAINRGQFDDLERFEKRMPDDF